MINKWTVGNAPKDGKYIVGDWNGSLRLGFYDVPTGRWNYPSVNCPPMYLSERDPSRWIPWKSPEEEEMSRAEETIPAWVGKPMEECSKEDVVEELMAVIQDVSRLERELKKKDKIIDALIGF